jgi:serine/threonine protein phosphatase 1
MSRLIAISDIHGCFRAFYELVLKVIRLQKPDRLILLGDYIDRGDQSREVVDFIIDLIRKGFDVTPLTGNHEVMLTDSFQNPDMLPLWLMNHGDSTLTSFGIRDIREIDTHYLEFFRNLEYYNVSGKYIFVHAGLNDHASDPFADKHTMVWTSSFFYHNPLLSGMTVIHGHRPKTVSYVGEQLARGSQVICIDTGCVYDTDPGYGNLSALEINSMTLVSVPNR